MSNEAEKEKLVTLGIKVNTGVRDRFYELKDDGSFDTAGQFMETLLERYSNPLKVNRQNEELVKTSKLTIDQLSEELETTKANCDSQVKEIERLKNVNVSQAKLIEELTSQNEGMKSNIMKTEGHVLVPVTPLQMRCLQYLAERENRHYNRKDITPETFFMYAVQVMLIEGNKFSVDSVPDKEIARFKKELGIEDGK